MIAADKLIERCQLARITWAFLVHIQRAHTLKQKRTLTSQKQLDHAYFTWAFLVHIQRAHTLKQKRTLTSQKQLDRAYFSNWLGPHGKLWAPHIAYVNFFLLINRIGIKETIIQYHLAYQWFGENLQITLIIAVFII